MPSVTGKVYNHSKRMKEKRALLDGIAAELRRIIGEPLKPRCVLSPNLRRCACALIRRDPLSRAIPV